MAGSALAESLAQPLSKSNRSPFGVYRSGDRCLSIPGSTRKAVGRVGNSCPLGWASSGSFCLRYR